MLGSPLARSPLTLTLVGYAALAVAVFFDDGAISDIPAVAAAILVVLAVVAVVAWGKALQSAVARVPSPLDAGARVAWIVALGSLVLAFVRAPGPFLVGSVVPFDALFGVALVLVGTYAIDLRGGAGVRPGLRAARRALLFFIAAALGALALHACPDPHIDVFPVHQLTAQAMLDGKPIYAPGALDILDSYHGTYKIYAYPYLPLTAYLTAISYAITHDVRWANLVSQLVAGVLLWFVAERCARRASAGTVVAPGTWADLLAATLLFHPRGLLVLQKAWVEPMALPFLGAFVLAAVARRPVVASVCLGLVCAAKQHLALYLPFLLLTPGVGVTGLVIAGGVAVTTMAPYLLSAPLDLFRGTIVSIASTPFRNDALALPAALSFVGVTIPSWVGFVAALVPLGWLGRVPREVGPLLLGSCVMFGLFYILGRQAFCNYYYLLDATSLFAAAALASPTPDQGTLRT